MQSKSFTSPQNRSRTMLAAAILLFVGFIGTEMLGVSHISNLLTFLDPHGASETFSTQGAIDTTNPFFQDMGTNGRTCATCHQPGDGWSVTPTHIQARFNATQGMDPIFRPVDGANCPNDDVSTLAARQAAYDMLLSKGLIRVSIGVPAGADFSVTSINDPHGCSQTTSAGLALYRRPLPATNISFLTTVMWDGRESTPGNTLVQNIEHQAMDATLGHAQGTHSPTDAQLLAIANFQMAHFTAQQQDNAAGNLAAQGGDGGAVSLSKQSFSTGENDPLGPPNTFDSKAFTIFDKWDDLHSSPHDSTTAPRESIARGEALFNTMPIHIAGVGGLADMTGTCTTCHNSSNVGNHSVALALNIGITDYPALPALDTTGLPVYNIHCDNGQNITTTDPGRALFTGHCADIGKTKGPILRGLSARAPYFHNGSAATLDDVINFYDQRFKLNLTAQQKQDLVAFLGAL